MVPRSPSKVKLGGRGLGLELPLLRLAGEERVEAFAGRLVDGAEVGELHGVRSAALGERAERCGVAEGLGERHHRPDR